MYQCRVGAVIHKLLPRKAALLQDENVRGAMRIMIVASVDRAARTVDPMSTRTPPAAFYGMLADRSPCLFLLLKEESSRVS